MPIEVVLNRFSNSHPVVGFTLYLSLRFDAQFDVGLSQDNELLLGCLDSGIRFVRNFRFIQKGLANKLMPYETEVSYSDFKAVDELVITQAKNLMPKNFEEDVMRIRRLMKHGEAFAPPSWDLVELIPTPIRFNLQQHNQHNQEN